MSLVAVASAILAASGRLLAGRKRWKKIVHRTASATALGAGLGCSGAVAWEIAKPENDPGGTVVSPQQQAVWSRAL